MSTPVVLEPNQTKHPHADDTFRQILHEWERRGMVEIKESPDNFVWWGETHGDILLYDWDRVDPGVYGQIPEFRLGLFGNQVIPSLLQNGGKCLPWVLWSRNPVLFDKWLQENSEPKPIGDRTRNVTFLGKIENRSQAQNRFGGGKNWEEFCDEYDLANGFMGEGYKYDQEEYFGVMADTKYALLLPGFGPKCNRDIEAVGVGCVPIATVGVDTNYYDPWYENVNYIKARNPEDIPKAIEKLEKHLDPQEMSEANRQWYMRNCSVEGCFETTMRIIHEHTS